MTRPPDNSTGPFFQTSLLAWHARQKERQAAEGGPGLGDPAPGPQAAAGPAPGMSAAGRRPPRRRLLSR